MNNLDKTNSNLPAKNIQPHKGFEEPIDKEDLLIPRAELLQALSPKVIEGQEGCRPGVVVNSISGEKLPVEFIPIFKYTEYIKFNPRNKADPNFDAGLEPGQLIWKTTDPDADQLAETKFGENGEKPKAMKMLNFLCRFEGYSMPVVLSFSKTSYKAGKKLLTLSLYSNADMTSRKYKLISKQAETDGNKYFVYDIGAAGTPTDDERIMAETWYDSFANKDIQVHDGENLDTTTEENQ